MQDRCKVCVERTIGSEIVTDGTWVKWNLTTFCLEIVLLSVQDRCKVCAKCTISSEIILDAPDRLGDEALVEARFGPFRNSANLDAR